MYYRVKNITLYQNNLINLINKLHDNINYLLDILITLILC